MCAFMHTCLSACVSTCARALSMHACVCTCLRDLFSRTWTLEVTRTRCPVRDSLSHCPPPACGDPLAAGSLDSVPWGSLPCLVERGTREGCVRVLG